jgi:hypothetical protein
LTARRHTDKPALDPGSVRSLVPGHAALTGNRTIFPSTVVDVTADVPERLLVSGRNSRKLGDTVAKGRMAGYALYGLTLEERATCPDSCSVRDVCYGNGMHFARRHRIGDPEVFSKRLDAEIGDLLRQHAHGILVRLHVLGDFPSAPYVEMWAGLMRRHPRLACYGYTHRLPTVAGGDGIGDAVAAAKVAFPDRFRIRWSSPVPGQDGAVVIDYVPERTRAPEGLVCPAQTDATACCSSCGLCWEPRMRGETIVFIKHGATSTNVTATSVMAAMREAAPPSEEPGDRARAIGTIPMPANMRRHPVSGRPPEFVNVPPTSLLVEESYQRDLSAASIRLIRKIVSGWDWGKFKPPVCARTPRGLFVIDGQHTAIGAATHPDIDEIPVMVIEAASVDERARSFVAHNRDRVTITKASILVAEVAAGVPSGMSILAAVEAGGGRVPRVMPQKGRAKPGDIVSMGALRQVHGAQGPAYLERIVRIAVRADLTPIDSTVLLSLHQFLSDRVHAPLHDATDREVSRALRILASEGDLGILAMRHAAKAELSSRYKGLAALIAGIVGDARGLPAPAAVLLPAASLPERRPVPPARQAASGAREHETDRARDAAARSGPGSRWSGFGHRRTLPVPRPVAEDRPRAVPTPSAARKE